MHSRPVFAAGLFVAGLFVAGLFVATLTLAAPLAAQDAPPAAQGAALLVGSSSVNGAIGRTIDRELATQGIDTERHARSASGFARPDFFDWEAEVMNLGRLEGYRAVIIYAGGNDVQGLFLRREERDHPNRRWVRWEDEERWSEVYRGRVTTVVNLMCSRGARRVIVLLPVNGGRPGWSRRITRVQAAQRAGAEASRCGAVLDANDGRPFEARDGVHLTWGGAERMWGRIEEPLRALL